LTFDLFLRSHVSPDSFEYATALECVRLLAEHPLFVYHHMPDQVDDLPASYRRSSNPVSNPLADDIMRVFFAVINCIKDSYPVALRDAASKAYVAILDRKVFPETAQPGSPPLSFVLPQPHCLML
jgi:hypothetical protein